MKVLYLHNWMARIPPESMNGLRVRVQNGVDPAVRGACLDFARWLRTEFPFPLRLNVYIKRDYRIRAMDGDMVVGTIWQPDNLSEYPYIRLAAGDYTELVEARGDDEAMWAILRSFAHEIVHYFQHINGVQLTLRGEEIQASRGAEYILEMYDAYLNDSY